MLRINLFRWIKNLPSGNVAEIIKVKSKLSDKTMKKSLLCRKSTNGKTGYLIFNAKITFI